MTFRVHDDRACELGEGAFWHLELGKLFWCDITANRILCDDGREWQFDEHVSALGWVDEATLFVASEIALFAFDLDTRTRSNICDLEANLPDTRSNDGRADPFGGFWIGTMGKKAQSDAGAIYRYYKGELRRLFAPLTVPNSICFSPDGLHAFFSDTRAGQIMKVALDMDGWPKSDPSLFLDLVSDGLNPDGAITTATGDLLVAQWGAARVAQYDTGGALIQSFSFPTDHITCPALGGPDMSTLFATSALQGLSDAQISRQPKAGQTFTFKTSLAGTPAPRVIL